MSVRRNTAGCSTCCGGSPPPPCPGTQICVTITTCLTGALDGQVVTIKNPSGVVVFTTTTDSTGVCPCYAPVVSGNHTIHVAVTSQFQTVADVIVSVVCGTVYNRTITLTHKTSLSITYTCCCPDHTDPFGPLTLSAGGSTCTMTKTGILPDVFTGCTTHASVPFASSNCSAGGCTGSDIATVPVYWTLTIVDSATDRATQCALLQASIFMVDQPGPELTCIFSSSGCAPPPQTICSGQLCASTLLVNTSVLTCGSISVLFTVDLSSTQHDTGPYSVTPGIGAVCIAGNTGGSDFLTLYPWKKIFGSSLSVTIDE